MLKLQLVRGASGVAQFELKLKSPELPPAIVKLDIERAAVPVLVKVTVWVGLFVPTGSEPKEAAGGERLALGTKTELTDKLAIAIPAPTVRELNPECAGSAVLSIAAITCEGVRLGAADITSAAIEAAVGAAAEVPQKGLNPDTADWPQSAAVISTFDRVVPPLVLNRKLPEVMGVPRGV